MVLGGVERVESEGECTEGDDVESRFGKIAAYIDSGISKSGPLLMSLVHSAVKNDIP